MYMREIAAPVVKWIERRFPKPLIRVRFPAGVLRAKAKGISPQVLSKLIKTRDLIVDICQFDGPLPFLDDRLYQLLPKKL